jgi:hypothetical protein
VPISGWFRLGACCSTLGVCANSCSRMSEQVIHSFPLLVSDSFVDHCIYLAIIMRHGLGLYLASVTLLVRGHRW